MPRLLLVLIPSLALATTMPLKRDPGAYLIIGMHAARVSNLGMEPPGCNVGVNCAPLALSSRGGCGFLHSKGAKIPQPGQFAGNQACGPGSFYEVFRNAPCDLPAGTYGAVRVAKGARLFFAAGTTVVCSLNGRTASRITSLGPATILVPGSGSVRFNNSVDLGSDCGVLHIVAESGQIKL